jgi:hypothetical protein
VARKPPKYEDILDLLQAAVEAGATIFTPHAQDEMNEDDLFIFDLEQCVLTGAIVERQWDDVYDEWKYLVAGESTDGDDMIAVVKLDYKGQIVFITTYRL